MAIKKTFNGATILKAGAYTRIIVENLSGFPLQPTGYVGIIGEAIGGEPRVLDILEQTAIQDAKERYKSGPIADALELLVNPSKDLRIQNGASKVIVYKVNSSTQSELALANADSDTLILCNSKNYGADENLLNAVLSEGSAAVDSEAVVIGTVAQNYTLAGVETLILNCNGTAYTFTNTLSGAAITASAMMAELNTAARWSGSIKPIIASVENTNYIKMTLDPTVVTGGELDYGYIYVDATSTIDTILGITGSDRGDKGSRYLTLTKGTTEEVSLELGALSQFSIKYVGAGTLAKLSIKKLSNELKLVTDITGAAGDNLSIVLEDDEGRNKYTVKELVDQIDALAVYEATVITTNPDKNANEVDYYEDLIIQDVAGVIKADNYDFAYWINTYSLLAVAEVQENIYRSLVTLATPTFFTGATDGTSVNADWSAGFEAFKEERINTIVPLISKDKGSLTIDSINALCDNHVRWGWSTTGKSERNAYVSFNSSKTAVKDAAKALQSAYSTMVAQQARVIDKFGEFNWKDPWALACVCAGLQAGSPVGEPITYKIINVNNIRVEDSSWSALVNANEMIEAGVLIAEPLPTGGWRMQVGNTTYGVDANWVWNRISVIEASGFVAYDLRYNLELVFTGTKARTGTAEAMANFIKNRMAIYLREDITVGDDLNDGLGYTNLRIEVEGNTAMINVSVTPVQGIDFILPTIYLADIRQSA